MKAIKAAAVQAAPVYLNLDASIAKAAEIVSEAARNGFGASPDSLRPPAGVLDQKKRSGTVNVVGYGAPGLCCRVAG
ncbi:MAG: hypothetical protein WBD97_08970, partial [Pseudolabrys sp.]